MTSPGAVASGSSGHRAGMASQAIGVGGADAFRMGSHLHVYSHSIVFYKKHNKIERKYPKPEMNYL